MKISGIICEYNPLHLGHISHINYTKQKCDTVICLMSGNFTQRGTPACLDKYVRARHAILAGADLVLENPTVFATSSAENFAFGAVKILSALKCDFLSFGSECGDAALLKECAELLLNTPQKITDDIKLILSKGLSYPAALALALTKHDKRYDILNKPNNTLAVEYIKQLILQKSSMQPLTVERQDNYNSNELLGNYASSTAIREAIDSGDDLDLSMYIPNYVKEDLRKGVVEEYKKFIHTFLSTTNAEYFSAIEGVSEGLENRIEANAHLPNYDEMITAVKTRRYTLAKLQRILLAGVLSITKAKLVLAKETSPYARVLAIKKDRLDLLTYLSQTKVNTPPSLTNKQKLLYAIDTKASNLYSALTKQKGNRDLLPLQKV